jgi:26S proteasome regulatory subunit N1
MMYFLVTAMYPRFFITLDEELNPMQVTTRVGLVRFLSASFLHLPLSVFNDQERRTDRSTSVSPLFFQAVDVVGQAGKPRGISGFVTHQTPVRIGTTERAELATEEYFAYSHVLEGLVVLHKNEGYEGGEAKMDL